MVLRRCLVPPLRGDGVLAPTELTDISPHAVKNSGRLAGQCHLCPFHAAPLRHVHRPARQGGEPRGG